MALLQLHASKLVLVMLYEFRQGMHITYVSMFCPHSMWLFEENSIEKVTQNMDEWL